MWEYLWMFITSPIGGGAVTGLLLGALVGVVLWERFDRVTRP